MHRPIQAMIALQSPSGLVFGSAQGLDKDVFTVVVAGTMDVGTTVEFRLELPGLEETALGMMRVLNVKGDRGTAAAYLLQVSSVTHDDQEAFDAWRSAVDAGNIACSRSRHSSAEGWAESALNRGTTPAERAHAVAIQEERRARLRATVRHLLQAQKKGWPDPRDDAPGDPALLAVVTARSNLTPGSARASLPPPSRRPPLRSFRRVETDNHAPFVAPPDLAEPLVAPAEFVAPPDVAELFVVPPELAEPEDAAPAVAEIAAQSAPTEPAASDPDPRITLHEGEVEFAWRSPERYRRDHRDSLRFHGVFVPEARTLAQRQRIRVVLSLPGGDRLTLPGEVVTVDSFGAGIQFTADSDVAKRLVPPP